MVNEVSCSPERQAIADDQTCEKLESKMKITKI
jgi:hypothetical protein